MRARHCISKQLIETAQTTQVAIALEDLTGIRERTNQEPRPQRERHRSNRWAFFQLRQFITYKAALAGVVVAIARELRALMWAIAQEVPLTP